MQQQNGPWQSWTGNAFMLMKAPVEGTYLQQVQASRHSQVHSLSS